MDKVSDIPHQNRLSRRFVLAVTTQCTSSVPAEPEVVIECPDTQQPLPSSEASRSLVEQVWTEEFRKDVWTKKHLHLTGSPDRFRDLVHYTDIEQILRLTSPASDRLQFALEGRYVDRGILCDCSPLDGGLRPANFNALKVEELLKSGATLIVNALDEIHEPAGTLANDLETLFGDRVQVNLYASWRDLPGFDVHWDEQEVFILQVKGSKEWRLYGRTCPHPLRSVNRNQTAPKVPLLRVVMREGDVLYLPRGEWHSVHPLGTPTIHLTFGVHTSCGVDLARWLADRLAQTEFGRSDIPVLHAPSSESEQYITEYRAAVGQLTRAGFLESFTRERRRLNKRRRHIQLKHVDCGSDKDLADSIRIRYLPDCSSRVNQDNAEYLIITDEGRRILCSRSGAPVLLALRAHRSCTFRDFLDMTEGSLSKDDVKKMVAELCDVGLVSLQASG